ncbi:helix-turn-helix domain-containing protein [Streptomyces sp. 3N207]|uniref:helix-turn-helix domain-containing protein n=1 Tax=Streptomyces sp. 3N207 TaxID=3457417 RepID=UPI003FCF0C06
MPRWRSLPEDLDPQIREFASQLRRLVDRSGLSVATIADRTGYSKSSWERYLNGRLLPPRGATQALAEVTGTDVRHLGTMWELAERAWSRSEMRHDTTLEAIQIAQARAALNEPGEAREKGRRRRRSKSALDGAAPDGGTPVGGALADGPADGATEPGADSGAPDARVPDAGIPDGGVPPQGGTSHQGAPESGDVGTAILRKDAIRAAGKDASRTAGNDAAGNDASRAVGNSASLRERRHRSDSTDWGASARATTDATTNGTATSGNPGTAVGQGVASAPGAPGQTPAAPPAPGSGAAPHGVPVPPPPGGSDSDRTAKAPGGRRKVTVLLASLVAVLVVAAGAVLFFNLSGGNDDSAGPEPSPSRKSSPQLPAGVKCSGKGCSGKDPEDMGCGGKHAGTNSSAWVGTSFVEVRYSKVCKASWARITRARTGDALRITGPGGQAESDKVRTTNDAYTEMVSVGTQNEARACATLAAGGKGCTVPGKKAR